MTNPFDNLAGFNEFDSQDGLGFIKKIGKELKRTGRKIEKEVSRSKIAQAALVVAAGIVVGPAAMALVKGIGGAAAGAAASAGAGASAAAAAAGKAALSVAGTLAKTAVTTAVTSKLTGSGGGGGSAADSELVAQAQRIDQLNARIASDPGFAQIVAQMQARGASQQEIMDMWAQSNTYRETAVPQVESAVYPALYQQYQGQGFSPGGAAQMASMDAQAIAQDAVQTVQTKAGGGAAAWVVPAVLVGLTLLVS